MSLEKKWMGSLRLLVTNYGQQVSLFTLLTGSFYTSSFIRSCAFLLLWQKNSWLKGYSWFQICWNSLTFAVKLSWTSFSTSESKYDIIRVTSPSLLFSFIHPPYNFSYAPSNSVWKAIQLQPDARLPSFDTTSQPSEDWITTFWKASLHRLAY